MRRPLLILSCSARKSVHPGETPAYLRYDGPAFQVLRRSGWPDLRHERGLGHVRVAVLSAEYGLISGWSCIPSYDRRMDDDRAAELGEADAGKIRDHLAARVIASSERLARLHYPSEVCVVGGQLYRQVVERWQGRGLLDDVPRVVYTGGHGRGIGHQLGALKTWLGRQRRPAARRVS